MALHCPLGPHHQHHPLVEKHRCYRLVGFDIFGMRCSFETWSKKGSYWLFAAGIETQEYMGSTKLIVDLSQVLEFLTGSFSYSLSSFHLIFATPQF